MVRYTYINMHTHTNTYIHTNILKMTNSNHNILVVPPFYFHFIGNHTEWYSNNTLENIQ